MRKIFVTGIGTDVGKTIVSAVLVEALKADYWKPIQAGTIPTTDSLLVKELIFNTQSKIYPEAFLLREPMSPHAAAELEHVEITIDKVKVPETTNTLIIEGAGGLMVPLNKNELVIDLIKKCDAEVILVIQNYLGSINHSLLSIELLKQKKAKILGVIISGNENKASEEFILNYSRLKLLGRINKEVTFDKSVILKYIEVFKHI